MNDYLDETTPNPTDTLVFRIVEKDNSREGEDTDIYMCYDTYNDVFLIRGKRSDVPRIRQNAYSYECETRYSVYELLSFLIPKQHDCVFELYTYYNLPSNKNDITFDLLRNERSPSNEMAAYVNQRISYKNTMKILSILRCTTNEYIP
jgi:hypothetical protein